MQLTFLGSGPAEAIPRESHTDPICMDAKRGGKSKRMRSAALISHNKTKILIDSGPDISIQLRQHKPDHLDGVLLTHGHQDAVSGLKELDQWLGFNRKNHIPLITDKHTAKRLTTNFGKFEHLEFEFIKDSKIIRINQLEVQPFLVWHTHTPKLPTHGYKIGNMAYASDFFGLPPKSKKLLHDLDAVVLDGAMYFEKKMPTHITVDNTIKLAIELNCSRLIITQSGHTYPPHHIAEVAIKAYRATLNSHNPKRVDLAYDGMVLKI